MAIEYLNMAQLEYLFELKLRISFTVSQILIHSTNIEGGESHTRRAPLLLAPSNLPMPMHVAILFTSA